MSAYYNEIDPFAAQWLRELIAAGHIAPGIVDERSIEDVRPDELTGFTQCHFFAGIGAWSYALRQAGWSDDRPVWTGSCPCQPFSPAGKGGGFNDERHLWPAWHWHIEQCRPSVIFGEQVASKSAEPWIDLVQADLEAMEYAFGCIPFPSASVGAPHIRDRAYWVADSSSEGLQERISDGGIQRKTGRSQQGEAVELHGDLCGLADSEHNGYGGPQTSTAKPVGDGANLGVSDRRCPASEGESTVGSTNGFWRNADWLGCRDGKFRPVEPSTFPLADGATNRVGRLRGYGNAINAEAAKAFIRSFLETL